MDEITIPVVPVSREAYGITHESVYRYRVEGWGTASHHVRVWSNVNRPNPRNGDATRYASERDGGYVIDGGNGRYLDPNNRATNDEETVLIGPDSWSSQPVSLSTLSHGQTVRLVDVEAGVLGIYTFHKGSRNYGHLVKVQ